MNIYAGDSNLPDGAANDPSAPYNQKDPKMTEFEKDSVGVCEKCEKNGDVDENSICEDCFEPEEIDEDEGDDDPWESEDYE